MKPEEQSLHHFISILTDTTFETESHRTAFGCLLNGTAHFSKFIYFEYREETIYLCSSLCECVCVSVIMNYEMVKARHTLRSCFGCAARHRGSRGTPILSRGAPHDPNTWAPRPRPPLTWPYPSIIFDAMRCSGRRKRPRVPRFAFFFGHSLPRKLSMVSSFVPLQLHFVLFWLFLLSDGRSHNSNRTFFF